MFEEDVYRWEDMEPAYGKHDEIAMAFVASEVNKFIEMCADNAETERCDEYPLSLEEWKEMLGEELAYQRREDPTDFWYLDVQDDFERISGRVDAFLPYYLENYEPAFAYIDWDKN